MRQIITFTLTCFLLGTSLTRAQNQNYALEAEIEGGKAQLEQVLQTQLTLPKTIVAHSFEKEVVAYFDINQQGEAENIRIEGQSNNVLRKELIRIVGLMHYVKKTNEYKDPYFIVFNLSASAYNRYYKQKSKLNLKKELPADSSFTIYTKADYAPEYFKNGETGLEDFVLSTMEYPRLAIEKSVEGTVVIDFVVETNGYVTGASVRQGLGAGCSDEALRVIRLTKWQPAVLGGKFVRYKTSYPITFSLRNISNDNSSSSRAVGQ